MIVDPAPNPAMPEQVQIRQELDALLAAVLQSFQRMGINGYTVNAIGAILSKIDFDKMEKGTLSTLLDEQSKVLLDKIKVALIRQSLAN